ncbi:amidohydrolase family protein [Saccharothrix deserti]|uniref:amidohydrolase family protein n=1 Tax=Saccharothrix deserti TaxID=2593674 RepID=UPI00192E604F|nr:amidohydrolase family protein [Saccharothrix deserti]
MGGVSRRSVLVGGVGGVGLLAHGGSAASAVPAVSSEGEHRDRRIDVHHHCTPPGWLRWAESQGILDRAALPWWAEWDARAALSAMDGAGVGTAVVSVAMPAVRYRDGHQHKEGLTIAYHEVRDLVDAHPGRFAFLSRVRLDDVDLDVWSVRTGAEMGAVGCQAFTHGRSGTYVGDQVFDPLLAELDALRSVLVLHPTDLPGSAPDQAVVPGIPGYVCDYALDTTRAALNLVVHGTLDRFPNVTVVLPHGGGFLPYVADRVTLNADHFDPPLPPGGLDDYLRRFHYDTAAPMSWHSTPTLLSSVSPTHLHFGSDWPVMSTAQLARATAAFDADPALDAWLRRGINRDNALRLFPALRALG